MKVKVGDAYEVGMRKWLRRIRGAIGMGLTWAIAWGLVGGLIMEGIVDPHGRLVDMWPQTLAIPGFLGGVVFSVVLWLTEHRRRFDELSLPRFAAWGVVAGLLLGVLVGSVSGVLPLWLRAAVIIGPVTLLSAASAAGSLALARLGERRELLDAGPDPDDARLGRANEDKDAYSLSGAERRTPTFRELPGRKQVSQRANGHMHAPGDRLSPVDPESIV